MAVMVLVEVQANSGTGDELVATMRKLLPETRAWDGLLDFVVYQSQDDKDNLVMVQKWEKKSDYEGYLAWRQETGVLPQLMAACSGPPNIRYYDITDA